MWNRSVGTFFILQANILRIFPPFSEKGHVIRGKVILSQPEEHAQGCLPSPLPPLPALLLLFTCSATHPQAKSSPSGVLHPLPCLSLKRGGFSHKTTQETALKTLITFYELTTTYHEIKAVWFREKASSGVYSSV